MVLVKSQWAHRASKDWAWLTWSHCILLSLFGLTLRLWHQDIVALSRGGFVLLVQPDR